MYNNQQLTDQTENHVQSSKYVRAPINVNPFIPAEHIHNIQLPYSLGKDGPLILMIFNATNEEIKADRLLNDHHGQLLRRCLNHARKTYPSIPSINTYRWIAVNFNFTNDPKNWTTCFDTNKKRINGIIDNKRPDYIWTFCKSGFNALLDFMESPYSSCKYGNLIGTPVPLNFDKGYKPTLFPIIDFDRMFQFNFGDRGSPPYLLGYMAHNLANALNRKRVWSIEERTKSIRATYINTIQKFRKMMKHVRKYDVVCVDTETTGLERVQVRMVTIQLAVTTTQGFFIPFLHYDTPFNSEEIEEIRTTLYDYFMTHEFKRVVFHNTTYDLNILRSNLRMRYVPFNTWDIQDGEYANEENMKEIVTVTGTGGFYNLENLSIQYGFMGYKTNAFGKSDRKFIKDKPLDTKGLIEYGVYDVCVCLAIYKMQLERAAYKGHAKYETLVGEHLSDTQHVFSSMNQTGALVDVQYLWWLDSDESPFKKELKEREDYLLGLPEIKIAEDVIRKKEGIPETGLFGKVTTSIFKLNTKKHIQCLFFDVLGIEAVNIGKDGTPKIDKDLQSRHRDNPVIDAYSKCGQVLSLINNYVKGTLTILSKDNDAKIDNRIRSDYKYHNVVTFRTSSSEPNLQNIPERGILGKHIKRCFISPEGTLIIKIDYSAAEVRCLGNVAKDTVFGKAFKTGVDLRKEYLKNPTTKRKFMMNTIGDVHMVNVGYFFGTDISKLLDMDDVKKIKNTLRNQIKHIVFGLVYGRGIPSIAKVIDKDEDYTEKLIDRFYKRFKLTYHWLLSIEKKARSMLFVENPMGARRHLWPYMLPESWNKAKYIYKSCDRKARNSPIQGYASMINYCAMRLFEKEVYTKYSDNKTIPMKIFNTVHDSVFVYVEYPYVLDAISMLRTTMTVGVQNVVKRRFNDAEFPIPIEIDFDIGGSMSSCIGFDGKLSDLYDILVSTLRWQRKELNRDIDVIQVMDQIFGKNGDKIPEEFRDQITNGFFSLKTSRNKTIKEERV